MYLRNWANTLGGFLSTNMAAAFSGWCRTKMSNLSSRHLKQIFDSFPGGFGSRHLIRDSFPGGFGLRNLKHSFPAISGCSVEKGLGFSKGVDGWFSPRHSKAKAMNSFSTISSRCVGFSGIGIAGKGFCSSTLTSTSNEIEKVSNGMIPFTDFYSQLPDFERQGLLYYRRIIKFVRPVFSFLRLCVKNNEYSANPFLDMRKDVINKLPIQSLSGILHNMELSIK